MSTTTKHLFTVTLAVALLATAAVAGTAIAQPSENTTQSSGSFTYDGETLFVQNATEQTIRGETSLEAGTEVSVRIQSGAGSASPFLKTTTATVSENGTFAATFDLSEVAANTSIEVSARANDTDLAQTEGRIVEELPETTDETTATETTNDAGQPGFGVVAALLALCGSALVALRGRRV